MPIKHWIRSDRQKHCPRCATWRDFADFGKDRSRKDGLGGWCLACRAEAARLCRTPRGPVPKDQHRAHMAVSRAIRAGRLVKPTACQSCGRTRKIEAHHYDGYEDAQRLVVVFLCRSCHMTGHASERAELARARLLAVAERYC